MEIKEGYVLDKIYKNKIRLNSPRDVQKLLARTINLLNDDQISESKARTIGYIAEKLNKSFETVDLQKRLDALEEQLKESGSN